MNKELAAAILTQVFFQSSPTAADHIDREVNSDAAKGSGPATGAITAVVLTYRKVLEAMG